MNKQTFKIVENSQKFMPCNIEAEQAVIGSILVSNDIFDEVSPILDAQKFFDPFDLCCAYLSKSNVLCPSPEKLSFILKHPVSTIIIGSGKLSKYLKIEVNDFFLGPRSLEILLNHSLKLLFSTSFTR